MKLQIKKTRENTPTPMYAKRGDAGLDLTAMEEIDSTDDMIVYGTGIAVKIPEGYVGLVFPRSSIRKYSLVLANSVGVIDSGYIGEIQVTFLLTHLKEFAKVYKLGDRICQLVVVPIETVQIEEMVELPQTERGTGGHGSSGS